MIDGHFLRHLRRMRLIYKKAQDELVSLLRQHLGAQIRIAAADAGMHLIVWLLTDKDTTEVIRKAKEQGVILYAVDELSLEFKHPAALMMGFTGFKREMMEQAVLSLKKILAE